MTVSVKILIITGLFSQLSKIAKKSRIVQMKDVLLKYTMCINEIIVILNILFKMSSSVTDLVRILFFTSVFVTVEKGVARICFAAFTIISRSTPTFATGVSYTSCFMCSQTWKSKYVRSGLRAGQGIGPPHPIQ